MRTGLDVDGDVIMSVSVFRLRTEEKQTTVEDCVLISVCLRFDVLCSDPNRIGMPRHSSICIGVVQNRTYNNMYLSSQKEKETCLPLKRAYHYT